MDLTAGTAGGTLTHTFTVRLPRDGSEDRDFSAYAFNVSQVKSQTDRSPIPCPRLCPPSRATPMSSAWASTLTRTRTGTCATPPTTPGAPWTRLPPDLTASGHFAHVYAVPLVSDDATNSHDATRAALHAVLDHSPGTTSPTPRRSPLVPDADRPPHGAARRPRRPGLRLPRRQRRQERQLLSVPR